MKKGRHLLNWTPEIILLLQVFLYWYYSSPLNPIAITMFLSLVLLFIFKNKILGFVISILFFFFNLSMCLALASELREFPSWTERAIRMLFVTGGGIMAGLIASTIMLIKWAKRLSVTTPAGG